MTWREWMTKYLTEKGLWGEQAIAVIAAYLEDAGSPMAERMDDVRAGYQKETYAAVAVGLDYAALEWIDANKPNHFARPMFLPKDEREKLLGP